MTMAEQLRDHPTNEILALQKSLPQVSAASKSESRTDRIFEDGSILILTSREGAEVVMQAREADEHEVELGKAIRAHEAAEAAGAAQAAHRPA